MPGMPVFQDSPSQLKGQIYVLKGTAVTPLEVDTSGNLTVAGNVGLTTGTEVGLATGTTVGLATGTEVGLATGTTVGLATGTNSIGTVSLTTGTEVGLATGTTVGLAAGTNSIGTVSLTTGTEVGLATGTEVGLATGTTVGLAAGTNSIGTVSLTTGTEVGLATGTEVGLATGATVGLAAGTNSIGKVQNDLVFTNLDSFGAGTILTPEAVGIGATVNADSQDISVESSYNWFIKNEGTVADQDITLMVELSPDGTNWIEDTGVAVSIPFDTSKMITVNNFLKNARFVITGGIAATTVISCYQAQH